MKYYSKMQNSIYWKRLRVTYINLKNKIVIFVVNVTSIYVWNT